MASKKKSHGITKPAKSKYNAGLGTVPLEKIVMCYLAVIMSIFWVYSTNCLFNIKNDKYTFFCTTTFIAFAAFSLAAVILLILRIARPAPPSTEKKKWLCVADIGMYLFFVGAVISTLLSDYREESITGSMGRRNGLILIFAYLLCYIMISYFYKGRLGVVYIFLIMGMFVCVIGIANHFSFDPLDYINKIAADQRDKFISTIGNINFFASFVCVYFAASFGMFMVSENIVNKIFCIACLATGSGALIASNSDLGFFAVFVFMGIMSIYAFKKIRRLHRYIISWLVLITSMKLMPVLCRLFGGKHMLIEPISNFFMFNDAMYYVIGVLFALTLIFAGLRKNDKLLELPSWLFIIPLVVVILCVIGGIGSFIYFSWIDTETDLGVFNSYLRFGPKWGTNRGYIWSRSLDSYAQFDPIHKLFGSGPDTLKAILDKYYGQEISANYNVYFDSAHNEYIEWLVTLGLVGTTGILTMIIGGIVRLVRCSKKKPELVVFYSAALIYALQAIFNIGQPLTTPMLFLFLSMGISISRSVKHGQWIDL